MSLETFSSRETFAKIAALEESVFPMDRAALAIALEEYPNIDMEAYLRRLDTLAARVQILVGEDRSSNAIVSALNEVIFLQEGLRGNTEDYYDPRNSFLNEVLDRKRGIPISLSVIYMEVARRIDFPVQGVGFPSHFIVKHVSNERETLIDPFNLGRIMTTKDCQDILDGVYKGSVVMQPSFLRPMEKKAIVSRMLYNLKGIYTQKEEYHKAIAIVERILLVNPGILSEIRDRGLLYMQTSLFAKALADLEYYLARSISPEDISLIQDHINNLRRIVCCTN